MTPEDDPEIDAALRDAYAFAPGAAEEAAARFRVPARRSRWPWVAIPVAAAAGVMLGLRMTPPPPPPPAEPVVLGLVTVATGPVRTGTGRTIPAGTPLLATDGGIAVGERARATLVLADGTELRLDRGTKVVPRTPPGVVDEILPDRALDVAVGRVWARVTPGSPFLFSAGPSMEVTVTGTELSVSRGPKVAAVQLYSGSATVNGSVSLKPGQEVEFEGGVLSSPRAFGSEALATGWMLELVANAGGHDRELAEHMDRLITDLGRTKAMMVEERKLVEDLGGSCRVPLARYLVSETAQGEDEPRRKAARVLVRIADLSVATDLARALRDDDPEVRVSAARAIQRLSRGLACPDPEAFREDRDEDLAAAADAWARAALDPK